MSDGEQHDASDSEVNAEGSVEKQPAPFTDEQMQMEVFFLFFYKNMNYFSFIRSNVRQAMEG